MKKLFVTAICILCSHWLLAGEIWISPKGSDFNDGTRQSPKATLTSALRQAREWRRTEDNRIQGGITIYMEGGTYAFHEPVFIRPEDSGTKESPTIIRSVGDEKVILSGGISINFNGLKNEIGAFAPANSVLIETEFLRTLDTHNFFSGYAEMLKHGLISNTAHWAELLNFDSSSIDYAALKQLVGQSVQVKEDIVEQDPFEHGIRKALNLGHTVGHAFESMALAENRPVLHGYAVAWGIVCELYLSHLKVGFPKEKMRQTIQFIKDNYGVFTFDCKKYDQLYAFMTHDKKNTSGTINFTLLKDIGDICINQTADKDTIFEMLDFYRECMGI